MFRDYGRSFKKAKDPLPPIYNVIEFDMQIHTKVGGPAQTLQLFQTPIIAIFCAIIVHLGD